MIDPDPERFERLLNDLSRVRAALGAREVETLLAAAERVAGELVQMTADRDVLAAEVERLRARVELSEARHAYDVSVLIRDEAKIATTGVRLRAALAAADEVRDGG